MKKFVCDICGKETSQYDLSTLYDYYQIDNIKDVCKYCNNEIRDVILRIDNAIQPIKHNWVKKFIQRLK